MSLPFLPSGIGIPQWVNANLWGVICAVGCHTLANVLRLVAHKRSWG